MPTKTQEEALIDLREALETTSATEFESLRQSLNYNLESPGSEILYGRASVVKNSHELLPYLKEKNTYLDADMVDNILRMLVRKEKFANAITFFFDLNFPITVERQQSLLLRACTKSNSITAKLIIDRFPGSVEGDEVLKQLSATPQSLDVILPLYPKPIMEDMVRSVVLSYAGGFTETSYEVLARLTGSPNDVISTLVSEPYLSVQETAPRNQV